MKCEICEQEKSIKHYGTDRVTYICINSKCPDYFEPALRQVPDSTPLQLPIGEELRGPGIKLDIGKPLVYTEFLMQFPRAIRLVALVGERGSNAPGHVRSGWKSVVQGYERYSDALGRHLLDEAILATSEEVPSEDPMHDLLFEAATSAWNAMSRLEHLIKANRSAAERLDPTREV